MKVHQLIQGTPEWNAYRATHFNASDAPAMMGCSPYETRSQLIHRLATGQVQEVDAATQRRFDEGHRIEALARPLAEKIIGEDLYPVVGSMEEYSASFDGLTMAEDTGFEHKTLNDELRACMRDEGNGYDLPLQYQVQMEQQLMVSGAERILFMASKWDGDTLVEELHCWYASDPALRAKIGAGWIQFKKDLAAYQAPEVIVPAVAAPQMGLPAVSIQVNGSIALVDNLDKFGTALTAYIEKLNRKPETDQDFANLEDAVKRLKAAEDQLDSAESSALGQAESIDSMRRKVALHRETARTTRLLIDKLVKAEKENRRAKIICDGVADLHAHIKSLMVRTRNFMPTVSSQFQDVVKGLKSLDSMKDKVATELARCKIEANAIADRISFNLELLDDQVEFAFLFPDAGQIVLKASDDFTALVNSRITDHKAAKAREEEATRERIRAEEQAKAEKDAREKLAAEQSAIAKQDMTKITSIPEAGVQIVSSPAPAVPFAEVVAIMPASVRQAMAPEALTPQKAWPLPTHTKAKPETPPTLTLGEISKRLSGTEGTGLNVTSAFMTALGFEAANVKAAKLYHEEDFPAICKALIDHISEVQEQLEPATA